MNNRIKKASFFINVYIYSCNDTYICNNGFHLYNISIILFESSVSPEKYELLFEKQESEGKLETNEN